MWTGASEEHLGVIDNDPQGVTTMIASISIADPTAALMLAELEVDDYGSVRTRRGHLRRRQRRYQRHARLRKLLA
jgi:hypothetical protein